MTASRPVSRLDREFTQIEHRPVIERLVMLMPGITRGVPLTLKSKVQQCGAWTVKPSAAGRLFRRLTFISTLLTPTVEDHVHVHGSMVPRGLRQLVIAKDVMLSVGEGICSSRRGGDDSLLCRVHAIDDLRPDLHTCYEKVSGCLCLIS
jgi:hypothetical protein